MTEAICFYAFSALMIGAAIVVICHRQPIYSVLSLLVVMFCLAALFIMLGAYFVAALQVLLYAGAVLVLFLFVVMLLNLEPDTLARTRAFTLRAGGYLLAAGLLWCFVRITNAVSRETPLATASGTVEEIGRALFRTYLLPFELTSFLILAAVIGAVTLAKQEKR